MTDYGFVHAGRVFTPAHTPAITPADNDARNGAIERAELDRWATQPDRVVAYYSLSAVNASGNLILSRPGTITTWPGTVIGAITSARVYRHNFGGRMVSLTARGTNGATYYGRASYDSGNVIHLRKHTAQKGQ